MITFYLMQDVNQFTIAILGFSVFAMFAVFSFGVSLQESPNDATLTQNVVGFAFLSVASIFLLLGSWAIAVMLLATVVWLCKFLIKRFQRE